MRVRTIAELAVVLVLVAFVGASTAQGAGEPGVVRFTAAGDYGTNSAATAVFDAIADADPDLHLALGDLLQAVPGTEQGWCDLVKSRLGEAFPFELIGGNHDSGADGVHINNFSSCLPNQLPGLVGTYGRQWYVDVPQVDPLVRFVMLSPDMPYPDGHWIYPAGSARYNWAAAAIDGARATGVPWVVVGMHKPCLSLGQYGCEMGPDLFQLLMSKRVDLVLTGHEHLYQRTHQLGARTGCAAVQPGSYDADCVADADATMTAGAGTVFATVGTGGTALRTVVTGDAESGYFAARSGANLTPAHGILDVSVTADSLTAAFVPVDGAFTDGFAIHRGAPPPNAGPTAAFTSTAQGLTASFDGSGSSDPDGTVTGHAWNFGDGTTGTGATPQHAYTAAGTYQVTLTVTDDDQATHSVTQPVTVTEVTGPVDFVTDTFTRTVTGGLGTADVGGAWTTSGTAANFSVNGQTGNITLPAAGNTRSAWLGATTRTDTDYRVTIALDKVPTGSGAYLDVVGRRVGQNTEYRARLVMAANGRITVQLTALRGTASPVALATAVILPTTTTYAANTQLNVRMQVTGTNPTTVRLKVWPASQPEPTAWQTTATDTFAALQAAGSVGITAYLSGSVTNAPVVLRVSGISARPTA
ncbi:PKD domain-containing protein [Geodermatophilus sp. SYSU D00691]